MSIVCKSWAAVGMLLLVTGCHQVVIPGLGQSPETTLLTLTAKPLEQGTFELTGDTNLPDDTRLMAVALRRLNPDHLLGQSETPTYSILAYQPVTVSQGRWESRLSLWQVAADGRYQEAWQIQNQALNLDATPQETVQFAITLAPRHLIAAAASREPSNFHPPASLVRVTDSGEPFLWVEQSLTVGLPVGSTTPPDELALRSNGGWGDRYLLVPEPPLPYTLEPEDQRQTNALPTPQEYLQ
ncbi:MAG: hypothetical protein EA342_13735 [Leptolyngbya sp. LCM1.Bin17]|nr:MAG: hypothetical protein EA342_13735 [Leptolyngbya sp. LCM1.Bin17]